MSGLPLAPDALGAEGIAECVCEREVLVGPDDRGVQQGHLDVPDPHSPAEAVGRGGSLIGQPALGGVGGPSTRRTLPDRRPPAQRLRTASAS